MKNLEIIENQLKLGSVKTITSNVGKQVDYVELLFSSTTKAQMYFDKDNNVIQFKISDTDLDIPNLECQLNKTILKNLIMSIKNLYNQLEDIESEE